MSNICYNQMKRVIHIIAAIIIASFLPTFAAESADAILAKVSQSLTKSASTSVTFDLKTNQGSVSGTMTVSKQLFTFSAGDLAVWYDGLTQWTLQRSSKELSITEPTSDELMETNPFRILTNYKKLYTATLTESTASQYKIKLTASSKNSAVKSAVVVVNRKTMHPATITLTMQNGANTIVTIKQISQGTALPKSYFTFSEKDAGKLIVNDLR